MLTLRLTLPAATLAAVLALPAGALAAALPPDSLPDAPATSARPAAGPATADAPDPAPSPAPGGSAPAPVPPATPADQAPTTPGHTTLPDLTRSAPALWELAGLGLSLLLLGGGLRLRRRTRPTPGRHRASRHDRRAEAAVPTPMGDEPVIEDLDGLTARDLEDLRALDHTGIEEAPELRRSPLTGEGLTRQVRRPSGTAGASVPAARVHTAGAARSAHFDTSEPVTPETTADTTAPEAQWPRPALADTLTLLDRANRLAAAWEDRDVDELAAWGASDPEASLAGYVLAAAAATETGDPRAYGYLQSAFLDGRDPAADALLGPYIDQLTFHVTLDDLGVHEPLTCSRVAIGCALACAERAVGDPESAYGVLLELPDTPLVRALRSQTALDLAWPGRALRSLWSAPDAAGTPEPDPYGALLCALEGLALAASGTTQPAIAAFDNALDRLDTPDVVGDATLRRRVLFERARAKAAEGDTAGAWADLTSVLADDPDYPGATDLLKSL